MAGFAETSTDNVQMTMKFNGDNGGWSEKVYFSGANDNTMQTKALAIISYRKRFLPTTCTIESATLATLGKPRGSKEVRTSYPVSGIWSGLTTVVGDIAQNSNMNNPDNAVRVRFENDGEDFAIRWIHGLPDAQVLGSRLVDTVGSGDTVADTIPAPSLDSVVGWGERLHQYLNLVRSTTNMVRRRKVNGVNVYQRCSIQVAISKGYTRHDTGRPTGEPVGRASPR